MTWPGEARNYVRLEASCQCGHLPVCVLSRTQEPSTNPAIASAGPVKRYHCQYSRSMARMVLPERRSLTPHGSGALCLVRLTLRRDCQTLDTFRIAYVIYGVRKASIVALPSVVLWRLKCGAVPNETILDRNNWCEEGCCQDALRLSHNAESKVTAVTLAVCPI